MEELRRNILRYVIRHGRFTIPDIVELSGLSVTTVAKCVTLMREDKLIDILEYERTNRKGRRPIVYGVNPNSRCFLGVDVKNFELVLGLMNFAGEIIKVEHQCDFIYENSNLCLQGICDRVNTFVSDLNDESRESLISVNFNLGGRVDARRGTSATVFNLEETRDTPLAELLSERLGLPVFIENDTKAMAYGEYANLGDTPWQDVLFVNISWGLGLGIIIGGEIYYGGHGYSGEMGHMPVYHNNILCHCGQKGCMETEVSCAAIQRKLIERIGNGEASILSPKVRRGAVITANDILEAVESEDPLCVELVIKTATELGKHIAGMLNLFNPEGIIIGGTLSKVAPYYFLQQTALAIRQNSLKLMSKNVPVLTSQLGDNAGIAGACLLARNRVLLG